MNQELRALFDEDQADRRGEFPAGLYQRDERRRRRAEELLAQYSDNGVRPTSAIELGGGWQEGRCARVRCGEAPAPC